MKKIICSVLIFVLLCLTMTVFAVAETDVNNEWERQYFPDSFGDPTDEKVVVGTFNASMDIQNASGTQDVTVWIVKTSSDFARIYSSLGGQNELDYCLFLLPGFSSNSLSEFSCTLRDSTGKEKEIGTAMMLSDTEVLYFRNGCLDIVAELNEMTPPVKVLYEDSEKNASVLITIEDTEGLKEAVDWLLEE